MERRLQTVVAQKMARSIHHARIMIRQRHVAVGKQMVDIPSFVVRVKSEPHIQYSASSVYKTNKAGRKKRKTAKKAAGGDDE